MHPLLKHQLKRLGLSEETAPTDPDGWLALLVGIDASYAQADQDRAALATSLDVTSREMQRLYDELERSSDAELAAEHARVVEAKAEAAKASGTMSGFLANMSHEMRTPLNSILGFARILETERFGALTDRQRECLEYILRAGQHMLNLVNDLLDLRRLEEDRAAIVATRLPLAGVVDDAVQLVRGIAEEKQHAVTIALGPDLPDALGDRRAVIQILVNLLSNAIKFTPATGTITVSARVAEDAIVVAIEDTGVGIAAEDHPKLFTYFEQLGAKHAHNYKGSGVGLALTRALVEKLGGRIAVHSALGIGSTFEFSIPRWTEPS